MNGKKYSEKATPPMKQQRNWRHFQRRRLFPTLVAIGASSAAVNKIMEHAAFFYFFYSHVCQFSLLTLLVLSV